MKPNFNAKSPKAWATLATAVITAIVSILTALGVTVDPTFQTTATSLVTALLSLLTTLGVLYVPTDDPKQHPTQGGDDLEK